MSEAALDAVAPERTGGGLWIGFGLPLVLALLIHGVALLALLEGWRVSDESRFAPETSVLDARLIELEAATPAVVEAPAPAAPAPAPVRSEPAPARPEPAPPVAETPAPAEVPEPAPAEPASERIADFEDDALADLLAESLDAAIADEAARIGEARADAAVASFVGEIVRSIQRQWSRPPSARNGMEAELLIELVPTGELVSVEVLRGSANAAFDRSALAAVRAAAPFQVPDDPTLFEREFRRLRILFRPEDLKQ